MRNEGVFPDLAARFPVTASVIVEAIDEIERLRARAARVVPETDRAPPRLQ